MRIKQRRPNLRGVAAGLVALAVLYPAAAAAQSPGGPFAEPPSRGGGALWELGGGLALMAPQGPFGSLIDESIALGLVASLGFDDVPALRLRLDAGYVTYGSETLGMPFFAATDRIMTDVVTRNNIGYVGLGPELRLPYGPIQPYVNAFVGLSYFFTVSSIEQSNFFDSYDYGETVNFDDVRFAYGLGGGFAIPLKRSGTPVALKCEVQYREHGRTEYLVPGSIVEDGFGSSSFSPIDSDANFMLYQIGVTVGL